MLHQRLGLVLLQVCVLCPRAASAKTNTVLFSASSLSWLSFCCLLYLILYYESMTHLFLSEMQEYSGANKSCS